MSETHYRTCSLCETMCGLIIEHDAGNIISVKGDPDDPHSKGHICPKGVAIQDLHNDPDRLRQPIKRMGNEWVQIGWEEALDEVAQRLVEIQAKQGRDAVASYWGNPCAHNMGTAMMIGTVNKTVGSRNVYSATSVDQLPHQFVQYLMYGSSLLFTGEG